MLARVLLLLQYVIEPFILQTEQLFPLLRLGDACNIPLPFCSMSSTLASASRTATAPARAWRVWWSPPSVRPLPTNGQGGLGAPLRVSIFTNVSCLGDYWGCLLWWQAWMQGRLYQVQLCHHHNHSPQNALADLDYQSLSGCWPTCKTCVYPCRQVLQAVHQAQLPQ